MSGLMLAKNPGVNMAAERRLRNTPVHSVDVEKLFSEEERTNKEKLIPALEERLLQDKLKPRQEKVLRDFLDLKKEPSDDTVLNAIRLVMSTPEYQLT
jgi:hypothetical protein